MCSGEIRDGKCAEYASSFEYDLDVMHEQMMREGGLGFGVDLSAEDAVMSMHLQSAHGFSFPDAELIMGYMSPQAHMGITRDRGTESTDG